MGLLRLFSGKPSSAARELDRLAVQVAAAARDEAWTLVSARAAAMPLAEARGYIRARTQHLVEQAVEDLSGTTDSVAMSRLSKVVEQASSVLVSLIIRDVMHLPRRASTSRRLAA